MAKAKPEPTAPVEPQMFQLDALRTKTRNPRKISGEDMERLKKSVSEFSKMLPLRPIVFDPETMEVLGGNQRLEALRQLGVKDVPPEWVRSAAEFTEEEKRRFVIADNASFGQWDFEILEADWDLGELEAWGLEIEFPAEEEEVEAPQAEEDEGAGALPDAGVTVKGDAWELASPGKGLRHRVMCGDSTSIDDVEKLMAGEEADLFLTDPPYGVSYGDKNKFLNAISRGNRIQEPIEGDHLSAEDSGQLWLDVFVLAETVMTDKASFYIFSAQTRGLMMMMMMTVDKVFSLNHCLVWVKNNHVLGRSDYNYKHEPLLFGWKKKGTHEFFGGFQTSVFDFPKPQKSDLHPTMKPVALFGQLVSNSTREGGVVYDSFLGSGTTLIACEQLSRHCRGMEIDERYCDVIVRRWLAWMEKEGMAWEVTLNGKPAPDRVAQLLKQDDANGDPEPEEPED